MADMSVITAVYNGERFLEETIQSVLKQDCDFEYILIDDASSDKSKELILDTTTNDSRVRRVFNETNLGILPTYTKGVEMSTSPFFKILDHDDTLTTANILKKQVARIASDENIGVVGGPRNNMDEHSEIYRTVRILNEPVTKKQFTQKTIYGPILPFAHGTQLVRKKTWEELDKVFDVHLLLRVINSDWDIGYVNEPIINYRTHESNESRTKEWRLQDLKKRKQYLNHLVKNPLQREAIKAYWTSLDMMKLAWMNINTYR